MGAKLLSLVPKSLIFYEATNTQIEATSTAVSKKGRKRASKASIFAPSKSKSKMSAIAKVPDWDAFLFEGMYSEYVWNFDNAIEGMYLRTTVQLF